MVGLGVGVLVVGLEVGVGFGAALVVDVPVLDDELLALGLLEDCFDDSEALDELLDDDNLSELEALLLEDEPSEEDPEPDPEPLPLES